jgi:hypothetical protein
MDVLGDNIDVIKKNIEALRHYQDGLSKSEYRENKVDVLSPPDCRAKSEHRDSHHFH